MTNFKDYFKFPLKMWEFWDIKVFTDDDRMAFDWMIRISREAKESLIKRINGESNQAYQTKREFYHKNDGIVYCRILEGDDEGKELKMFRIRGWGMLTGTGGYHLPDETAAEVQDAFMEYCIERLNA